jgi:hypothetical protein
MRHVFFCRRGALRDLSKSGGDVKQVFHTVAHLARQQFVGFLRLLPLRNIEEDAEHDSIGDIRIVALPRAEIQRMSLPDKIRKSIS